LSFASLTSLLRLGWEEHILPSTGGSKGSFGESMELVIILGNWRAVPPFSNARGLSWWNAVFVGL
jgi:hypothetical protein